MTRLLAAALLPLALLSQDWPQLLGPTRNGVAPGAGPLAATWTDVWKKDVGAGFSAPVVAGNRVILYHRTGNTERVEAFDAATGKTLWQTDAPTAYRDDFGFDEGPRGAPAIAENRVYTYGAEGLLQCLDLATGKRLWQLNAMQQFRAPKSFFGAAASPFLEGNRVWINVGGPGAGIVAFDRTTGKPVWQGTDDEAGYAGPTLATIGGQRHLLFFTRRGLVDIDPDALKVRFQFPWRSRSNASVNAATPIVAGDLVFLSASYGTGATVLRLTGNGYKDLWATDEALSNHYATSVQKDGYLYGYHGRQEYGPTLRCVELQTGKVQWEAEGFKAGTVTLVGDQLLLLKETGELLQAPATPKQFRPAKSQRILNPTVRAYPAYANGHLYARNESTLVCLKLRQ